MPWGFLGMLALVASLERLSARAGLGDTNPHVVSWEQAGRLVSFTAPGKELLIFGDSQLKLGLLPAVLESRTGHVGYNFAVLAGPAPVSYFLLRRALEAGARPTRVLVDFAPVLLPLPPRQAKSEINFRWSALLSRRESLDLAWAARDSDLFATTELGRLVRSYRNRAELRASIRKWIQRERNELPLWVAALRRNWDLNRGAELDPKNGFTDDALTSSGPLSPGHWSSHPVNMAYARRFLALAARHGIAVTCVIPPLSPRAQARAEAAGDDARYTEFVESLRVPFARVSVIDARHAGFAASRFNDPSHLNQDGALALSAGVAELLATRTRAEDERAWNSLSEGPAPLRAAYEDFSSSLIAVQKQRARTAARR